MTPLPVWLYGDLVCPWSYLALGRLRSLETRIPISVGWRPLRRFSRPDEPERAGTARASARATAAEATRDLASELGALGLPYRQPVRVTDSGEALRAVEFAFDLGPSVRDRVLDGLFRAHFGGDALLDERSSLLEACERLGLDREGLTGALEDGRYDAELAAAEAEAERYGIDAVPVLLFGRLKIVGAAPVTLMESVARRALAET